MLGNDVSCRKICMGPAYTCGVTAVSVRELGLDPDGIPLAPLQLWPAHGVLPHVSGSVCVRACAWVFVCVCAVIMCRWGLRFRISRPQMHGSHTARMEDNKSAQKQNRVRPHLFPIGPE